MFNIINKSEKYDYLTSYNIENNEKLFSICIDNVFDKNECDELIYKTENHGYKITSLYDDNDDDNDNNNGNNKDNDNKQYLYGDVRESLRCIIDSSSLCSILEKRIDHLIPKDYRGKKYHSINSRFRFLKYNDTKHHFLPHTDGCYSTDKIMSLVTILIYLNDNYEGAKTSLHLNESTIIGEIIPKIGMVYLMDQDILHSVPNLITGIKYVIRTEIMYLI